MVDVTILFQIGPCPQDPVEALYTVTPLPVSIPGAWDVCTWTAVRMHDPLVCGDRVWTSLHMISECPNIDGLSRQFARQFEIAAQDAMLQRKDGQKRYLLAGGRRVDRPRGSHFKARDELPGMVRGKQRCPCKIGQGCTTNNI